MIWRDEDAVQRHDARCGRCGPCVGAGLRKAAGEVIAVAGLLETEADRDRVYALAEALQARARDTEGWWP